jgi:hypothetical protein
MDYPVYSMIYCFDWWLICVLTPVLLGDKFLAVVGSLHGVLACGIMLVVVLGESTSGACALLMDMVVMAPAISSVEICANCWGGLCDWCKSWWCLIVGPLRHEVQQCWLGWWQAFSSGDQG